MKMCKRVVVCNAILLFLLSTVSPFMLHAQRRAGGSSGRAGKVAAARRPADKPSPCGAKWRGNIVYFSTMTDESKRVWANPASGPFARGSEVQLVSRTVKGEIKINGEQKLGEVTIDARQVTESTREVEDCCNLTLGGCTRKSISKSVERSTLASAGRGQDGVSGDIVITGSKYRISFSLPRAMVKDTLSVAKQVTGACSKEANVNESQDLAGDEKPQVPIPVVAEGTLDPKNPNVLEGSIQPDKDTTIRWYLERVPGDPADCEGKLSLAEIRAEHHVFPDPTAWETIGGNTVDGNLVRLVATVTNSSDKSKGGSVVFKEKTTGQVLGTKAVTVPGNDQAEVEVTWDTSGFAWTDDGKKGPEREIEATLGGEGEPVTTAVTVYPKPVVLVHGLWSNAAAWSDYHNYLEESHSYAWKAFAVGADPEHGLMDTGDHAGNTDPTNSIFQNAGELGKQIKFVQESENAWNVDVVAHSMGGLISRFYIHHMMKTAPGGRPTITHLVMLGTPNQGSPWADIMFKQFLDNGHHVEALRELKTDVCRTFNSQVTNRKGVKFSIIYSDSIPFTGGTAEAGDGVVSRSSAIWQITDVSRSPSLEHTALTGKEDFVSFVLPRLAIGPKKATVK